MRKRAVPPTKSRIPRLTALGLLLATSISAPAGEPAPGQASLTGLPAIAEREIVRRQEKMAEAETAMQNAAELLAENDYEAAIGEYKAALDSLPDAPMTAGMRSKLTARYADASIQLARQRAEEGRYDEAIDLVEAVLAPAVAPDHKGAKRLLGQLNDPDYYSPALTPDHVARVQQVEEALRLAMGYFNLGDFDAAEREYFRVLNYDRYNTAARMGLERNEREKYEYFRHAYDETRARFMRELMEEWETKVPSIGLEDVLGGQARDVTSGKSGVAYISAKLQEIVIPRIEFNDTPLEDAIEFLRQKSIELDTLETNPSRKGVNIIIRDAPGGGGGLGDEFAPEGAPAGGGASPRITLALSNVPLVEALRYTTELAGRKFKIEAFAVTVVPLSDVGEDLFTKVFKVPPTFLASEAGGGDAGVVDDPFAPPSDTSGPGLKARPTAKVVLEQKGITFPPGSSAFFNTATAQLIVRNTQSNMELIEAYVDTLAEEVQKQIYITSKFVEINQNDTHELGFDWLLGPFNIPGSDRAFGAGGTTGNARTSFDAGDYVFIPPGSGTPVGVNPVTSGNRSGVNAVDSNRIDDLLTEETGVTDLAPGIFSLAGVFTDPEFQVVIRALDQKKGVDLLSAPSVTARSGQRAKIEVIREFIYPTEYDPPEIPDRVATGGDGSFPVTPATPTAFETRNTGVTLEVDPVIGADGYTIDLNLVPEVVEFEGFINYGSPIQSTGGLAAFGLAGPIFTPPATITENRIEMPVFSTRKVTTAVTIWDGQTVAIGGLIREDVQNVEDKVPVLGSLPLVGRLFQSKVDFHLKKNLTVFVTVKLIDPAGQTIRKFGSADSGLEAAAGDTIDTNPLIGPPVQ